MIRLSHQIKIWILIGISLLLLIGILHLINTYGNTYGNNYTESFDQMKDLGQPNTNHNVNLPINTKSSCKNMCGPISRCSITGEQCSTDVDCYGCQPTIPSTQLTKNNKTVNIRGENNAGKLSYSAPTYSVLTTDIGTHATLYNKLLTPPLQYNEGTNTWKKTFNAGTELYNKKYKIISAGPPNSGASLLQYPQRNTLSGQFTDDGPLAANDYLE